jgi:hypothetical protein
MNAMLPLKNKCNNNNNTNNNQLKVYYKFPKINSIFIYNNTPTTPTTTIIAHSIKKEIY